MPHKILDDEYAGLDPETRRLKKDLEQTAQDLIKAFGFNNR